MYSFVSLGCFDVPLRKEPHITIGNGHLLVEISKANHLNLGVSVFIRKEKNYNHLLLHGLLNSEMSEIICICTALMS